MGHDPSCDTQPSFEVTIETKRHRYCRSHQGGHIRTLRRGSYRRAVSGNIYGIQELFARVETVGIQPRDRHAGEMLRKVFINRHFVVASFVRTGLCLRNEHDYCVFEPIKQTSRHACARMCSYRARRGDVARRNTWKFVTKLRRKTVSGRRDGGDNSTRWMKLEITRVRLATFFA